MPRSKLGVIRVQDAMLAIAATAIGLAWAQAQWEPIQAFAGYFSHRPNHAKWFLGDRPLYQMSRVVIKDVLFVATAMVGPWMVLLLLQARRGGRRGRFWRARRPVAVACLAGTVVLLFELAVQSMRPVAAIRLIRLLGGRDSRAGCVRSVPGALVGGALASRIELDRSSGPRARVVLDRRGTGLQLAPTWGD